MTTVTPTAPILTGAAVKAVAEWDALSVALKESGVRPPCWGRGSDFFAPPNSEAAEQAAATCWTCPAQLPCLIFATANGERHGVWGGTNLHSPRAGASQPGPPATKGHTMSAATGDHELHYGDQTAMAHSERFRKVSNRYPRRVAEAYGRDLARAASDDDATVAAVVAEWELDQGQNSRDWVALGRDEGRAAAGERRQGRDGGSGGREVSS